MSEELKPCPFCIQDSQPHIQTRGNRGRKYVVCPKCLANGPFVPIHDDDSRAIAAWNRRTPTAPEAGQSASAAPSVKPWPERMSDYYAADGSKQMHGAGYFKDQEIADLRARLAQVSKPAIAHASEHEKFVAWIGTVHDQAVPNLSAWNGWQARAQLAAKGREPVLEKSPEFAGKSPETRMDAGFHGAGNFAPQPAALLEQVTREEEPNWRALGYVEGATVRFNVAGGGSQDGVIKWAHGNGSLDVECDGKTFGWSARYCDVVAAPSSQGEQEPNP